MSAWLVEKGHIDVLVQAAFVEGLLPHYAEDANALGKLLWRENHLSLNARYGDPVPDEIDYTFEGVEAPLDDTHLSAAVHCYDYQTCEHGEAYTQSAAFRLCEQLLECIAERHDGKDPYSVAAAAGRRDTYKWGYNSVLEAVAS